MREKAIILISIILIIGLVLFILTGCDKNTDSHTNTSNPGEKSETTVTEKESEFKNEKTLKNMSYKYPDNAEFTTETDTQAVLVFKGNEKKLFSTVLSFRSNSTTVDFYKSRSASENDISSKEINGKKWDLYTYSDAKTYSQSYACQSNNDIYIVSFPMDANDKTNIDDFIEEFMNNISFK